MAQGKSYTLYGFDRALFETSSGGGTPTLVKTPLDYPNKITANIDSNTINFEGGDKIHPITRIRGMTVTIDADCLPAGLDALLWNKTEITTGLPAGETSRMPYLLPGDLAGVLVGFRGRAPAEIYTDGTITDLGYVEVYVPIGTLTLTRPGIGLATSGKPETTQYTLSPVPGSKNIIGTALPGVTDADDYAYYYIVELP